MASIVSGGFTWSNELFPGGETVYYRLAPSDVLSRLPRSGSFYYRTPYPPVAPKPLAPISTLSPTKDVAMPIVNYSGTVLAPVVRAAQSAPAPAPAPSTALAGFLSGLGNLATQVGTVAGQVQGAITQVRAVGSTAPIVRTIPSASPLPVQSAPPPSSTWTAGTAGAGTGIALLIAAAVVLFIIARRV